MRQECNYALLYVPICHWLPTNGYNLHKMTVSCLHAQSPLTLHPPVRCMYCMYALVVQ